MSFVNDSDEFWSDFFSNYIPDCHFDCYVAFELLAMETKVGK